MPDCFLHVQQALVDGDYPAVEALDKVLADIIGTGRFNDPLAKDYLDIVLAAAKNHYEILNLDIQGDHASARVSSQPPVFVEMEFEKVNGIWQIQP